MNADESIAGIIRAVAAMAAGACAARRCVSFVASLEESGVRLPDDVEIATRGSR